MIKDIINYLGEENLEELALRFHRPPNGAYVYVKTDGTFKVIRNQQKIDFNSKYRGWDFYSTLISINKPIASKLIQSNNYYTFWCRNTAKLKDTDIDTYFAKLELPPKLKWHKEWVKEHIYELGKTYEDDIIKIFFPGTRDEYRKLGLKYWHEKSISVPNNLNKKNENPVGAPLGYSTNAKKPFTIGRTPFFVSQEEGLKIKFVYDILKGCTKRGYNNIYINAAGLYLTNVTLGPPDRVLPAGLFIVTKINNKGALEMLDMEAIPSYNPFLTASKL